MWLGMTRSLVETAWKAMTETIRNYLFEMVGKEMTETAMEAIAEIV